MRTNPLNVEAATYPQVVNDLHGLAAELVAYCDDWNLPSTPRLLASRIQRDVNELRKRGYQLTLPMF